MERPKGAVLERVGELWRGLTAWGTVQSEQDSESPTKPRQEVRYFPGVEDRDAQDLRLSVGELLPLMYFRQVPQFSLARIVMPIAGGDLMDAPIIRGLIGGIERSPCVDVKLQCGLDIDLPVFPHREAWVRVAIPHGQKQKCGLELWSARSYREFHPDDFKERKGFFAFRQDEDSLQEFSLFDGSLTSINRAHQVVGELKAIFRRLRREFLVSEASRISLTPAQKAMVEAVNRLGMEINQNSESRGLRDQFALIGEVGDKRELADLTIVFSAASSGGESAWKNPRVLDALDISWGERRKVKGKTASEIIVSPDRAQYHSYSFNGRGTLRIWPNGADEHLVSVDTHLRQVDSNPPFLSVQYYPTAMFKRHLLSRLGVPLDRNAPYSGVLLGTSIPLEV